MASEAIAGLDPVLVEFFDTPPDRGESDPKTIRYTVSRLDLTRAVNVEISTREFPADRNRVEARRLGRWLLAEQVRDAERTARLGLGNG